MAFHLHDPIQLATCALLLIPVSLLYYAIRVIYNIYFHPLNKFPGHKLWIAFPILRHISEVRGHYDRRVRELHTKYGEVVRISPTELSFITPQAWKDIYGYGHHQLPKDLPTEPDRIAEIFRADNKDHTRIRRTMAHAFSDKALLKQEAIVKSHVDSLIQKLEQFASSNAPADMTKWYTLAAYDVIGDLAFAQPFGGIERGAFHPWVTDGAFFSSSIPRLRMMIAYPLLFPLAKYLAPKGLSEKMATQLKFARMSVDTKLAETGTKDRGDFMDFMLRNKDNENALSHEELVVNAETLILAGSDTTATLLAGVTYWLLKTPDALRKVTNEVRSVFKTEEGITFLAAASKLPYMLACLDEGMRIYPPIPTGLYRRTLPGPPTQISGYDVPENMLVSVHQSAAYWSELNFHKPRSFVPERWLPETINDPSSPFYNDKRDVVQPFSIGPRNCIGRNLAYHEMRVVLARILWNFDLELSGPHENWWNTTTFTTWVKPPLMVKIKKREMPVASKET